MLNSFMLAYAGDEVHHNDVHFGADTNEIIWASVAFFVVVGLLAKFAGPAIKKGLADRTSRIESDLNDAQAARDEAEQSLIESKAELPDVESEATAIRAEAIETASRLKVDIVAKANADAETLRARSTADIETSKRQAIGDLRDEVSRLTRDATSAVVVDNLDEAAHGDLIEGYITQVTQL